MHLNSVAGSDKHDTMQDRRWETKHTQLNVLPNSWLNYRFANQQFVGFLDVSVFLLGQSANAKAVLGASL